MLSSLRTGALSAIASTLARSTEFPSAAATAAARSLSIFQVVDDAFDALGVFTIVAVQGGQNGRFGRHDDADVVAEKRAQFVLDTQVLRIAHGDRERVVVELDGDDAIHLGHRLGDFFQGFGRDGQITQGDGPQRHLLAEGLDELFVVDQAHVHSNLAQELAGTLLLFFDQRFELIVGDVSEVNQDLSNAT